MPKIVLSPIEKRNAAFAEATPAEKRVIIARDVIAQLDAKRLIAEGGSYLSFEDLPPDLAGADTTEIAALIDAGKTTCTACAKGSVFMSACRLGAVAEKYHINGGDFHSASIVDSLRGVFEPEQLHLMEAAFEGNAWQIDSDNVNDDDLAGKSTLWADQYKHAIDAGTTKICDLQDRTEDAPSRPLAERHLRLVMQNVIDNDGEFEIDQLLQHGLEVFEREDYEDADSDVDDTPFGTLEPEDDDRGDEFGDPHVSSDEI